MTQEVFLQELQEILRSEIPLDMDSSLDDLDGWDSMAMLAIIDLAENEFGISLDVNDFRNFNTPRDIFERLTGHGD